MPVRFLPLLLLSLFALPLTAATADLGVSVIPAIPATISDPGQELDVHINVYSNGPDPADHARITVVLPGDSRLLRWQGQFGGCSQSGSTVVCESPQPFPKVQAGIVLTIQAPSTSGHWTIPVHISSDASDPNPANDNSVLNFVTRLLFVVETNADSGSGSLRQQIENVNATCDGSLPCRIVFRDNMTIEPLSPLPALTAPDTWFFGIGIVLRGTKVAAGSGLVVRTTNAPPQNVNGVTVEGLTITDFPGNGIDVDDAQPVGPILLRDLISNCTITGNGQRGVSTGAPHVNLTIAVSTIANNGRSGISFWNIGAADVFKTRIASNGASGVFLARGHAVLSQNTIVNNHEFGIATGIAAFINSGNVIHDNGAQPIDIFMDGPSRGGAVRPPVLIDAAYDAATNKTVVRGHLTGAGSSPTREDTFGIALASSSGPNAAGYVDAETVVPSSVFITPSVTGAFERDFTLTFAGDLRGKYLVAWTTYQQFGDSPALESSELSDGIPVH